ncbi:ferric reductase-like transmembrane domain-containing protein [Tepidiforma sp.]|uniref:ferric reductase-like transmembrane domain-containing protein n=1 Tax=Tepidiforma sp. TaxID=2682230 RepID=UPI0026195718|nr:ferric reductase-like transmembrane domain-containing protein [Tepidiforma sp.]MCX7617916.1 ferric reductase-like transmembrane domain-containing protein [Tepidiforma sp.]
MSYRAVITAAVAAGLLAGAAASLPLAGVLPPADGHGAWYASRAAGLTAYLFLWLSLAGGLLMSSAWFDGLVNRARLLAAHQAFALAGLALGLGHALVLIPDGWTDFGLADLFIPFASSYERADTALGTIALYLFAIVTFSFWFRGAIGPATWRWVHRAAFVAYLAALWHGVRIGTDTSAPPVALFYVLTASMLVGALTVRLVYVRPRRQAPARPPSRAAAGPAG